MSAHIIEPSWCAEIGPHTWHQSAPVTVPPELRTDMSVRLRLVQQADFPQVFVEQTIEFAPSPDPDDDEVEPLELAFPLRMAETMAAEILALVARAEQ